MQLSHLSSDTRNATVAQALKYEKFSIIVAHDYSGYEHVSKLPYLLLLSPMVRIRKKIKEFAGRRLLKKESEVLRIRKGSNYHAANSIGLLYKDTDESFFKAIRKFAKTLKEKYNVQYVAALGFIDDAEKNIPVWQQQKLEFEYFTRDDLNWHLKPMKNVQKFAKQPFDILIDFSGGNVVPINYVLKSSVAGMKVGVRGVKAEKYCDFVIDMQNQFGMEKYVEQLNLYLSNPNIK